MFNEIRALRVSNQCLLFIVVISLYVRGGEMDHIMGFIFLFMSATLQRQWNLYKYYCRSYTNSTCELKILQEEDTAGQSFGLQVLTKLYYLYYDAKRNVKIS